MAKTSTFNKYYAPAIVTGLFLLMVTIMTILYNRNGSQLVSKETTEIKSPDGTIITRETENYR